MTKENGVVGGVGRAGASRSLALSFFLPHAILAPVPARPLPCGTGRGSMAARVRGFVVEGGQGGPRY